jgi:hypothetical protein
MMRLFVVIVVLLCGAAFAQEPERRENNDAILVPIMLYKPLSGANGSAWATELWVRNENAVPVPVRPFSGICGPVITTCFGVPPVTPLAPGASARIIPNVFPTDFTNPSLMLYAPRGTAAGLRFSLRTADIHQREIAQGARIPVVPEQEFVTTTLELFDVSVLRSTRSLLRVYDLAYQPGNAVRVRVYRLDDDALLADQTLPFGLALPGTSGIEDFIDRPAFAQLLLDRVVSPDIRVRITMQPLGPARIWGFATETDNATNDINVVAPGAPRA